jgi:hypothetical protein
VKTPREQLLLKELAEQIDLLKKANEVLEYSYKRCSTTGVKEKYSDDELETFDALTSRFARASDILTHKIFILIDTLEFEEKGTFIDRLNRAEKRGLIPSMYVLKEIRETRNDITHEYLTEELTDLFRDVLRLTPILLESCGATENYTRKLSME